MFEILDNPKLYLFLKVIKDNHEYRVRYLIYSANTSLNTEHITIYFCEQTLSGHCLTITDHIKPKILCLSLNAASAEANFELGAEQCI